MPPPRFIQIHWLASYPAVLLNRDDAGLAKRLPFGGAIRARVSSQALKRRWRFAGESGHETAKRAPHALQNIGMPMGERSKEVVERIVMPRALEGLPYLHATVRQSLTEALIVALYGEKAADPKSRQALFFGHPEIDYTVSVARGLAEQAGAQPALLATAASAPDKAVLKALAESSKKTLEPLRSNLRAMVASTQGAAGLESALFGRMVTSDVAANVNAPVHVAHAFTVHAIERELDYVTAVDDLRPIQTDIDEAAAGSAGIFDIELTSGLFYGYVTVDVNLLIDNLGGDVGVASQVIDRLVRLIALTSPGAKKGSTAPYANAELLLVEVGNDQPRTLANAFRNPVALRGDLFKATMQALGNHLSQLDKAYGAPSERWQVSVTPPELDSVPSLSLVGMCEAIRARRAD